MIDGRIFGWLRSASLFNCSEGESGATASAISISDMLEKTAILSCSRVGSFS